MNFAPLHPPLSGDLLALCKTLPRQPAPVTLEGRSVRLVPLDMERDLAPLYAVSNGEPAALGERSVGAYDSEEVIWRYMFGGPFPTIDDFRAYLQMHLDMPNALPCTVFDSASGGQIGMACYLNNLPEHLKIELGSIWYSPLAQGSKANTEATYLMLRHAFALGYRRLEWKCNALNERSRRAALRMGFTFEGVQDAHMIVKGRNRDTAWFRILDSEWPGVKTHLETWLYG